MRKYCTQCAAMREPAVSPEDESSASDLCPVCGTELCGLGDLPPGTLVEGFMIKHEIGRGGMGVVYLAEQMNLKREVALKILSEELASNNSFVEGFFREARAAASLNHPNIVQAIDAGSTPGGIYYFVMELIEGENLDERIAREGRIDLDTSLNIAEKISAAMAYAWEKQKLCHGDIKPENIILKPNGEIKLADLGLAKNYNDTSNATSSDTEIMATPLYAAPELIRYQRDKIGYRTDMYSFGATLYHMLAGKPPFPGSDPQAVCEMQLNSQARPLIALDHSIPSRLSILVDTLMEKDIYKRPETWRDVHSIIEEIQEHRKQTNSESPLSSTLPDGKNEEEKHEFETEKHFSTRSLKYIFFVLSALLILSGGAFFVLHYFSGGGKPDAARNAEALGDPSGQRADAQSSEWSSLKERLGSMKLQDAINEVSAFIAKYPDVSTEDAIPVLNTLMARREREENIRAFREEVDSVLSEVETSGEKLENDLRRQKQLLGKIGTLRKKQDVMKIQNVLGTEYQKRLQVVHGRLVAGIARLEREERQRKKEEELRRLQKASEERAREMEKKLLERKAREMETRAMEDLILLFEDHYGRLSGNAPDPDLEKDFQSWFDTYASVPLQIQEQGELAQNYLLSLKNPFWKILAENDARLKGFELFPETYPGYGFDSVDEKLIKLSQRDGKVILGKRIPWESLKGQDLKAFMRRIIGNEPFFKSLVRRSQEGLLGHYILANGFEPYVPIMARHYFGAGEFQYYWDLSRFMKMVEQEGKAIRLWREIQAMEAIGKNPVKQAETLMKEHRMSSVYTRYASTILRYATMRDVDSLSEMPERPQEKPRQEEGKTLDDFTEFKKRLESLELQKAIDALTEYIKESRSASVSAEAIHLRAQLTRRKARMEENAGKLRMELAAIFASAGERGEKLGNDLALWRSSLERVRALRSKMEESEVREILTDSRKRLQTLESSLSAGIVHLENEISLGKKNEKAGLQNLPGRRKDLAADFQRNAPVEAPPRPFISPEIKALDQIFDSQLAFYDKNGRTYNTSHDFQVLFNLYPDLEKKGNPRFRNLIKISQKFLKSLETPLYQILKKNLVHLKGKELFPDTYQGFVLQDFENNTIRLKKQGEEVVSVIQWDKITKSSLLSFLRMIIDNESLFKSLDGESQEGLLNHVFVISNNFYVLTVSDRYFGVRSETSFNLRFIWGVVLRGRFLEMEAQRLIAEIRTSETAGKDSSAALQRLQMYYRSTSAYAENAPWIEELLSLSRKEMGKGE